MKPLTLLAAFAMAFLVSGTPVAADTLIEIGFCRDDGVQGGTAVRTRGATGCNLNAVRQAARSAAVEAAQGAAAAQCPPVNPNLANARCMTAQSNFAPNVTLSLQLQASAGATTAERSATSVARVGNSGVCVFTRPVAERNETNTSDRSCGWFIFTSPRYLIFSEAQAECGVICR